MSSLFNVLKKNECLFRKKKKKDKNTIDVEKTALIKFT